MVWWTPKSRNTEQKTRYNPCSYQLVTFGLGHDRQQPESRRLTKERGNRQQSFLGQPTARRHRTIANIRLQPFVILWLDYGLMGTGAWRTTSVPPSPGGTRRYLRKMLAVASAGTKLIFRVVLPPAPFVEGPTSSG